MRIARSMGYLSGEPPGACRRGVEPQRPSGGLTRIPDRNDLLSVDIALRSASARLAVSAA